MFEVVKICYFQTYKLEQNNASEQKVGHCDKTTIQIFFSFYNSDFLCFIPNTYVSLIFHAKIHPKIFSGSEEKKYFVFAIFSNSGHLGYST